MKERSGFSGYSPIVLGRTVDSETRCVHYHSDLDIIAIKFKCCEQFYPCFECHEETAGHQSVVWGLNERKEKAVLCGVCRYEMSIDEYLQCENRCPSCQAKFNPGCEKHYHLYFEMN
ncbi:MAG: chromophore lyase [Cyclobacteriaceae bacterium]|nr:chromophore lyase [Cyclobacteriaceae bacterium]